MQTLAQLKQGQLSGARTLKLSCNLTTFPPEILELADTLEVLDLSKNRLSALPETFSKLRKLKILFISDNSFSELPAVLGQCPEITMIGFKANRIERIAPGAFPAKLRWLILTDNRLEELPSEIGKCKFLQKLMLAGNHLTTLPRELAACQNLQLLRISANSLRKIPAWLLQMPRLAWLAVSGNPFSPVPTLRQELPEIPWSALEPEKLLGEGASGNIWQADWQTSESSAGIKPVAVKIFKGEVTSDGFPEDEMKAAIAAGIHPHLVPVLGKISNHLENRQGLVLELLPPVFKPLGNPPTFQTCTRDTFQAGTSFTLEQILRVTTGVAAVAAHLHSRGIMHGDLYAHNILVNDQFFPLLSDFGAATLYDRKNAALSANLERLDVRAFGYLLDDLLSRQQPDKEPEVFSALTILMEKCISEQIAERPDFITICKEIQNLRSLKTGDFPI